MRREQTRGPWQFSFRYHGEDYAAEFYAPADRRDGVEDVTVFDVEEVSQDLQDAAEQAAMDWVADAREESRTNYGNY